jgi:hypothetical protein
MKKERPMLMQPEMVVATIDRRKTKTRRTKGLELINENPEEWDFIKVDRLCTDDQKFDKWGATFEWMPHGSRNFIACPYGKPGDILWVRERTRLQHHYAFFAEYLVEYSDGSIYRGLEKIDLADPDQLIPIANWRPSIHMPKADARIWLEITDIRVERLNNISKEDALAEGIGRKFSGLFQEERYEDYLTPGAEWRDPVTSFYSLWEKINGNWDSNPWVWVISFKLLSTAGRPAKLAMYAETS